MRRPRRTNTECDHHHHQIHTAPDDWGRQRRHDNKQLSIPDLGVQSYTRHKCQQLQPAHSIWHSIHQLSLSQLHRRTGTNHNANTHNSNSAPCSKQRHELHIAGRRVFGGVDGQRNLDHVHAGGERDGLGRRGPEPELGLDGRVGHVCRLGDLRNGRRDAGGRLEHGPLDAASGHAARRPDQRRGRERHAGTCMV